MSRPKQRQPTYRLRLRGKYWVLSWTEPATGKTVALSTRESDPDRATIWRDQFIAGRQQPDPPPEPIVADLLDGYLADRKSEVAAYATLRFSADSIRRHVGNLEPKMLAPKTYLERREKDGVSDGTIRREVAVLRAALKWGARQQPPWVDRPPYVQAPPQPPPRDRWLSKAEVSRLVAACTRPHIRLFVLLAYHTAARAGAILDLTWDRVDLEQRRISFDRPGRRRTKKRRATVPIGPTLLAALQSAREVAVEEEADVAGQKRPAPHVIQHHGKPVKSVKRAFAAACQRAQIEDCSPHVLRHTAATHMIMAGVPLAEAARLLGDSEATVERIYGKHSPEFLQRAIEALDDGLGPQLVSRTLSEKPPAN